MFYPPSCITPLSYQLRAVLVSLRFVAVCGLSGVSVFWRGVSVFWRVGERHVADVSQVLVVRGAAWLG